jgi:hypothetical protein
MAMRPNCRTLIALIIASAIACGGQNSRAASRWLPPPRNRNVTISNGGLSVTFNLAWGAVVIGISNRHIAHGLNLVDFHDVGRELQVDQFLFRRAPGPQPLLVNPTQAGAEGHQAYYQHPHGSIFPQKGSPVVRWKAGRHRFMAVIHPWDYDTGKATHWVYTERVDVDRNGVAHFYYRFQRHGRGTFRMNTEIPTLYSDRTNAFMYPIQNPYARGPAIVNHFRFARPPVRLVTGAPRWGQHHLISKGWIANIDTANRIGIFYTTPIGLPETFGCFPHAAVSDRLPLGKTNVFGARLLCRPNEVYSVKFSVLVATPTTGPGLIARQKLAELRIDGKLWRQAGH